MIFNLFKSKPTLKELIPNGFVDIHSHILPGIDDGAKNIDESLEMISEMKKMGFSKIIGTPHVFEGLYNNSKESIKKSYELLVKSYKGKNKIDFAAEYLLDNSLIKKAQQNELLCIKDNLVLVEMSYISMPFNLYEILYEINVNGYQPVLAHPERYLFLHDKDRYKEYYKLKKNGCYFQLNLLSATDFYGPHIRKISSKLLSENLIDFVGSDIHSKRHILNFDRKIKLNNPAPLEKAINNNTRFR